MESSDFFHLPPEIPIITLPDVVLFPQATLPLFIFEPRYRRMLADSLATHSLFAVGTIDRGATGLGGDFEPVHPHAVLGIIRSSQKNDDGTSSILVQGLTRIRILEVVSDEPYRTVRAEPLLPLTDEEAAAFDDEQAKLLRQVLRWSELGEAVSPELLKFLGRITDSEIFADIVAYSLIGSTSVKLQVLAADGIPDRYAILAEYFRREIADLQLRRALQGGLDDSRIEFN